MGCEQYLKFEYVAGCCVLQVYARAGPSLYGIKLNSIL